MLVLYLAVINFFGLLTFSCGATFPMVFITTVTLVTSFAVLNSNYSVLSHYCPELLSAESYRNSRVSLKVGSGFAVQSYSFFKGLFALAISVIEVFGVAIRTVSLALRLVANLACGHILLTLFARSVEMIFRAHLDDRATLLHFTTDVCLWSIGLFGSEISYICLVATQAMVVMILMQLAFGALMWVVQRICYMAIFVAISICLRMLETLVCVVQAYVFYALSVNYSRS